MQIYKKKKTKTWEQLTPFVPKNLSGLLIIQIQFYTKILNIFHHRVMCVLYILYYSMFISIRKRLEQIYVQKMVCDNTVVLTACLVSPDNKICCQKLLLISFIRCIPYVSQFY